MLLEISQTPINKDLLIYKIKVDTKVLVNELIKLNRFDQFFTKSNQNKNDFNSIPPFEDWLTSTFPEVKDSMKYLLAAYIYYGMFQLEDSFRCIKKADLLFGQEKDDSSDIKAITLAGHIFRLYGVIDEAIKYYNLALSLLKEEDDPKQKASLILNLSLAHESKREHNLSKQFAEKALEIYEKIGDDSGRALALSYIGESYNGWEKYEDALKYLNLALGLVEKTGDLYDKVTILSFIAEVYERWAKSEEAIKRYLEIISIYELLGLYHDEAHASYSLAMVYQVIGKYELAVSILEKAIGLARSVNAVNVLPMLMLKLGEVLIPIKQYDKAISIDKEGIEICKNLKGSEKYIQYFENQINFAKNFK